LLVKSKEPTKAGEVEKTRLQKQEGETEVEVEQESSIWHESSKRIAIAEPDLEAEEYVPAETADELMEVGGLKPDYWEIWDTKHPYRAFMPAERETNDEIVTAALHRSMVEVFAAKELGRKLTGVQMMQPNTEDLTDYVQITPSIMGAALRFTEKASPQKIMKALGRDAPPPRSSTSTKQSGPNGGKAGSESVGETIENASPTESRAARQIRKLEEAMALLEVRALEEHMPAHRPRELEECKAALQVQSKYGWKPYRCPQCRERFTGHPSVQRHLKNIHPGVDFGPVEPSVDPGSKSMLKLLAGRSIKERESLNETEVNTAPTESEEDVAADRSTVDPLHPEPETPISDETAVKKNPTESEEDVAADRSTVDPLKSTPETTPATDETAVKKNPTESEEDVAADRSSIDPLHTSGLNDTTGMTYAEIAAHWDPSWLQISLSDPATKFFVRPFPPTLPSSN